MCHHLSVKELTFTFSEGRADPGSECIVDEWSDTGHVCLAEGDGQVEVLLFLEAESPQSLLLLPLTLPLGPL